MTLERELTDVILHHQPDTGAVEEVFVNSNAQSTLKLGQARGVCLLALARTGMPVAEYATRLVKKALVGTGGADKAQVQAMLKVLLPGVKLAGADAADRHAATGRRHPRRAHLLDGEPAGPQRRHLSASARHAQDEPD